MNNRKFHRIDLHEPCYLLTNGSVFTGSILNISRSGALVDIAAALPTDLDGVGGEVTLAFDLPRNSTVGERSLVCHGRIVRANLTAAAPSMAIHFTRMSIKSSSAKRCLKASRRRVDAFLMPRCAHAPKRDWEVQHFSE